MADIDNGYEAPTGFNMRSSKKSDEVDKVVGRNVRVNRLAKGMSQADLANRLGITFQQIQKYEKGTNRIGSGRLLTISQVLDVAISALFEGSGELGQSKNESVFDLLADRQSFRLIKAFSAIEDRGMRRSVVDLVECVAGNKQLP